MSCTIVVGLDSSPGSADAMRWALGTASRTEATVQPVMAWEYPALVVLPFPAGLPVPPPEVMQEDAEARASQLIESDACWADVVDRAAVTVAPPIVREGSAGRVLCTEAEKADLLVLGSRGLGSFKGVMLGSVSSYCARAASCPVVVVPAGAPDREKVDVVVIGVDGSELSNASVRWADEWADADALLVLVHAWDIAPVLDATVGAIDVAAIEEAADVLLAEASALVENHKVDTVRVRGDARAELERLARDADALVIGARGGSRLERLLLGSVAGFTVHHVQTPTVVVNDRSEGLAETD